jgi:hypothetical protein
MESEDVRFHAPFDRTQFDARNNSHAELEARGGCFSKSVECVMVGERHCRESNAMRFAHDIRRRARAIGRGGMHMEVDELNGAPVGAVRLMRRHFA